MNIVFQQVHYKAKKASTEYQEKKKTEQGKSEEGIHKSSHIPGSNGHSFNLANSAGVFPVRTQFELRSMMGILFKVKQKKVIVHRLRHKKCSEQMAERPESLCTMLEDGQRMLDVLTRQPREIKGFPDIFSGTDNKNLQLCWITTMAQLRRELLSGSNYQEHYFRKTKRWTLQRRL